MRSLFATLRQLVLPAGAGSSPRIVLGPDVPAELTAFYAAHPFGIFQVAAAILLYDAVGGYEYIADLTISGFGSLGIGKTSGAGVVAEYSLMNQQGPTLTQFSGYPSATATRYAAGATVSMDGPLVIDGRSAPRGWLYGANITTGAMTAAVSAETNVPSAAINVNVTNGRAYLYHLVCRASLSDMSQGYEIRVRRDTALTGTQVGVYQIANVGSAAAGFWPVVISLPWEAAATENLKLFFSIIRTSAAGTIQLLGSPGGGQARGWVGLEDVGDTTTWVTA